MDQWSGVLTDEAAADLILGLLPPGGRVLDVGCDRGRALGWDVDTGIPTRARLEEMGIGWAADLLAKRRPWLIRGDIMSQRSHVEVKGWVASHYDLIMDLLLLGRYQTFVERAIERMDIRRGDAILDLGSGTGRNICVIMKYLRSTGRVVGVDISQEMLQQARLRCRAYPQVSFLERRIEGLPPFHEEFDKVLISFTLHGFEDEDKEKVIANAYQALRPGGTLWILDYNEFDLDRQWFPFRWAFRRFECELASEFLSLDLEGMLARFGFGNFVSHPFLRGYVRLLGAERLEEV